MRDRVVITGSAGQVGSSLHDALRARGRDVAGVDVRASRCTDVLADVRRDPLPEGGAIVHCAAQVSVVASVEAPVEDADANVMGTLRVLEAARRRDASRVVYFSSAAAYGAPARLPIDESHPCEPLSPYGLSKLTGERYALLYARLYGLPVVVLRPFNIYSSRQDPANPYSGVIARFAERALAGLPGVIRGDGLQTRDFVHIDDVVQAIDIALARPEAAGGVFNVGTGRATNLIELWEAMRTLVPGLPPPAFEPARPGEILHSVSDITRLRKLGFEPRVDVTAGLRDVLFAPRRGPIA